MGMTIDDCIKMLIAKEKCMKRETSGIDTDCNSHNCDNCSLCYEQGTMGEQKMALLFAVDAMRQYQLMQDDYEARLKADLESILVDLQLEIEEQKFDNHIDKDTWNDAISICSEVIQQKINDLGCSDNE